MVRRDWNTTGVRHRRGGRSLEPVEEWLTIDGSTVGLDVKPLTPDSVPSAKGPDWGLTCAAPAERVTSGPRSQGGPVPMRVKDVKKVVLAYSGGLDTSVILRWLQTTYRCEVVTFTADLGQGEELGPARKRPKCSG